MKAATIIIRRSRGKLVVQATGQTARGQKYIKGTESIKSKKMHDKKFKEDMATAVAQLLGNEA